MALFHFSGKRVNQDLRLQCIDSLEVRYASLVNRRRSATNRRADTNAAQTSRNPLSLFDCFVRRRCVRAWRGRLVRFAVNQELLGFLQLAHPFSLRIYLCSSILASSVAEHSVPSRFYKHHKALLKQRMRCIAFTWWTCLTRNHIGFSGGADKW
jgi:hypothetical protein